MTPEKVLEVVRDLRQILVEYDVFPERYTSTDILCDPNQGLNHCYSILGEIVDLVHKGEMEEAMRWLGFVQGVLWNAGFVTLDELENLNRQNCSVEGGGEKMGYLSRQPTSNDLPRSQEGENPWLGADERMDEIALTLNGMVRPCAVCKRPTHIRKHMDSEGRCPDCRSAPTK